MYLNKEIKKKIFKKHGKSEADTGSTEGQIALFSLRIDHLTSHLKKNLKDFNTERSLVKLVGKRRKLLDYLKSKDIERYRLIVSELGLIFKISFSLVAATHNKKNFNQLKKK